MPYTVENPPEALEGLPKHLVEIWVAAFNSAFKQYKGDEGKSAGTAWAAVKSKFHKNEKGDWVAKEAIHPHGEHVCYCPSCNKEVTVGGNIKCNTQLCPDCDTQMRAKDTGERRESVKQIKDLQSSYSEIIQELGKRNAAVDASRVRKIVELCNELLSKEDAEESVVEEALVEASSVLSWLKEQEAVKTEDGVQFPAGAFAYTPDAENPSEWKLRLWEDSQKRATRKQLGIVSAALSPGGFRGQKAEIPLIDLPEAKRKVRVAYRSLGVEDEDIPRWVKEVESRTLLTDYIPLTEAKIGSKGKAVVTVIKPGFNSSKERYYPTETLARDYGVFEGLKMYADHPTDKEETERPERSIRDWVATLQNVRPDKDGAIIGEAVVVEPWMQEKLATLRDNDILNNMGISINAVGNASQAEIEGIKTSFIEQIVKARSVDFVTEAGAGGDVQLYEASNPDLDVDLIGLDILKERRPDLVKQIESAIKVEITKEVKKGMEIEEKVKELEGQIEALTTERDGLKTKIDEAEKARVVAETKSRVDEAVSKSDLPAPAKAHLLAKFDGAQSDEGLDEAIKAEQDYIAALSEAGKVRGLGDSKPAPEEGKKDLRESFKILNPEWTDEQLDIAVSGR